MNEQQFLERAHANPHDDSAEFRQALAGNPQRQHLVNDLKRFDDALSASLSSVTATASLHQALLAIPEGTLHPDTQIAAANDSSWRRNSAIAAALAFFIGVAALVFEQPANPMEDMVFSHLYSEIDFLGDESSISLQDVNSMMVSWVGTDFAASDEMERLKINLGKDCWVDFANGIQGFHLIMKGDVGPVTVMVIPNSPLAEDVPISDGRFEGIIHPTRGGNLVVVGEKEESIMQFSNVLAANINW